MALTALRKFALADKNRALYRMAVMQKISSLNIWEPRIFLVPDNYSTWVKTKVSYLPPPLLSHLLSSFLLFQCSILFLHFVNDLPDVLSGNVILFADGFKL